MAVIMMKVLCTQFFNEQITTNILSQHLSSLTHLVTCLIRSASLVSKNICTQNVSTDICMYFQFSVK